MPIYEYQCPDCGHKFDVIQKMSDDPITECPACHAGRVKKLISATSFVLKGSGWYKDHYGLKSGGGDSGESKAAGGSEAAPAAPAATPAPAPAAAPSSSGSGSSTPAAS